MVGRLLRGMAGTMLLWGVLGVAATLATLAAIGLAGAQPPWRELAGAMFVGAIARWALSGLVFAAGVAIVGRRRRNAPLTLWQMTGLGAAAALVIPAGSLVMSLALRGSSAPIAAWLVGLGVSLVVGGAAGAGTQVLAGRVSTGARLEPAPTNSV